MFKLSLRSKSTSPAPANQLENSAPPSPLETLPFCSEVSFPHKIDHRRPAAAESDGGQVHTAAPRTVRAEYWVQHDGNTLHFWLPPYEVKNGQDLLDTTCTFIEAFPRFSEKTRADKRNNAQFPSAGEIAALLSSLWVEGASESRLRSVRLWTTTGCEYGVNPDGTVGVNIFKFDRVPFQMRDIKVTDFIPLGFKTGMLQLDDAAENPFLAAALGDSGLKLLVDLAERRKKPIWLFADDFEEYNKVACEQKERKGILLGHAAISIDVSDGAVRIYATTSSLGHQAEHDGVSRILLAPKGLLFAVDRPAA